MRLIQLNPRWLPEEATHSGRYGMGVAFDCPLHSEHRIQAWFQMPWDGLPAQTDVPLHGWAWANRIPGADSLTLSKTIECQVGTEMLLLSGELIILTGMN